MVESQVQGRTKLAAGVVGALHTRERLLCIKAVQLREQAGSDGAGTAAAAPAVHIQHLPRLHPPLYIPYQLPHPATAHRMSITALSPLLTPSPCHDLQVVNRRSISVLTPLPSHSPPSFHASHLSASFDHWRTLISDRYLICRISNQHCRRNF